MKTYCGLLLITVAALACAQAPQSAKKAAPAQKTMAAAPVSATFQPGTVTGSFTVNGKKAVFKCAYAFVQQGSFHSERDNVYVILSDAPVTEAMLAEDFGLSKQAENGKLHAIRIEFDDKMQPGMGDLYHDGFKEMNAMSSQGPHEFVSSSFDSNKISGRLFVKPQTSDADHWQYSAEFSAPLNPKLKAMAKQ